MAEERDSSERNLRREVMSEAGGGSAGILVPLLWNFYMAQNGLGPELDVAAGIALYALVRRVIDRLDRWVTGA